MPRSPPKTSRRDVFVDLALKYAEDNRHGYSQKPPSGRWGPDYDCSSLLYFLANEAGYPVGTGSDKVRFTGTMLKDFEKAGFQILPFANVGISGLEIGDILLNLALHAEVYVGEGQSVGATGSETGGFVGEAGDQTGTEIEKHPVTTFEQDWNYILRPPSDETDEEGDKDVPMNYGMPNQQPTWPTGMNGMNRPYLNSGYPQGNLGQMNGYSQANAGYPQNNMMPMGPQGMNNAMDLEYVKGIDGANHLTGAPGSRRAVFDDDEAICYLVEFGLQGMPSSIRCFNMIECSEEMPQHLSPLMRQNQMPVGSAGQTGDFVTRSEMERMIKEMLGNVQSTSQTNEPNASRSGTQQTARAGRGN